MAFSANLDIPDCDIKDDIKLAGELRQYDPGVGGQNAALRFFFEVREALDRSTQSTPQDLGKKPSSWGSGPVGTRGSYPLFERSNMKIFLFTLYLERAFFPRSDFPKNREQACSLDF